VGGGGVCTLASDGLLVLSLGGEGGSIRGRLWLRGHGDRERGSGRRLQDLKSRDIMIEDELAILFIGKVQRTGLHIYRGESSEQ